MSAFGGEIGPAAYEDHKIIMYPALSEYIQNATQYVSSLSVFRKWSLWVYTLGSGGLNGFLVFGNNESKHSQYTFWVYNCFKRYNMKVYGKQNIDPIFQEFAKYFETPTLLLRESVGRKLYITLRFIEKFAKYLSDIINSGPQTKEPLIVYKVSSKYPSLAESDILYTGSGAQTFDVLQQPFNSTTWYPLMNFNLFLGEGSDCCFHQITINPGTKGYLYVPQDNHAYPFEKEILLAPGVKFDVKKVHDEVLSYIDKTEYKLLLIQDPLNLSIGPVYEPDPINQFKSNKKNIRIYESVLKN